jgi:hypothetical protein
LAASTAAAPASAPWSKATTYSSAAPDWARGAAAALGLSARSALPAPSGAAEALAVDVATTARAANATINDRCLDISVPHLAYNRKFRPVAEWTP